MYDKESYISIGHSRPRLDAKSQVMGQSQYVCDIHKDGMLYAKPVLSTEHHALIKSIDYSAAMALPGVAGIVTAEDLRDDADYGVTTNDQPPLAKRKVRYMGEMVALVAADTYDTACRAAELVKVDYERLPAVFDPRDALKPDAPIIHDEYQGTFYDGNIMGGGGSLREPAGGKLRVGDVEKGFAEADIILEREFASGVPKSMAIEPFATLAWPDDQGGITIHCNNQCVFGNAPHIARNLGLPLSMVRVMAPVVGGGFGEKNQLGTEIQTALLAQKLRRPVKLELTTEEHMLFSGTRHPVYFKYKLGAKKDGTLTALERTSITGAGAYASVAILITGKIAIWGCGPYLIPNQKADTMVVATNRQPGAAMRGFGMAQVTFAMETMMNMLADELKMDRVELRRKNMFRNGEHMSTGQAIRAEGISLCLNKAVEVSNWQPDQF